MKKFKFLLIPLLAAGLLTGCQNDPEFCARAIDKNPTLIGFTSGKEVFTSDTKVTNSPDLTAYLGLTDLKYQGVDCSLTWTAEPASAWSVSEYPADEAHMKFMPLYGEEEFDCSLTLTLSAKGFKSAQRKWNFHAAKHVKTDLTDYKYMSIQELQEAYATQGDGITPKQVYTYGKVVKTMKNNDQHLYTGVFIQDGNYGLQLYAGNLSKIWFAVGYEVGDTIMACGTLSPYNGLLELKPDSLEYISVYKDAPTVAEPVVNDITSLSFDTAGVGKLQTSLVKMDGLAYKSTKTKATSSVHGNYYFTKDGKDILMYVNYHIGEEFINQINTFIDSLQVGDVVNFTGILTIYNTPQLLPIDGGASLVKA